MRASVTAIALCVAMTGCASLTMSEKEVLDDLQHYNVDPEQEYSQGLAMGLNILPGVGNFYLGQTGYGIANLLFWPISVVWAAPQGWVDAPVLNQKYTVDFYRTRAGKQRMIQHLQASNVPEDEWPHWVRNV